MSFVDVTLFLPGVSFSLCHAIRRSSLTYHLRFRKRERLASHPKGKMRRKSPLITNIHSSRSTINGDRRSRIDQQPPPRSHAPLSHRPQKYSQEAEYVHRRSVSSRDVLLAGHVPSAVQVGQLPDTHFLPHTFHVCGIMRAVYYSLLSCGLTITL